MVDENKMRLKMKIWAAWIRLEAQKIALCVVIIELVGGYGVMKMAEYGLFNPKIITIEGARAKTIQKIELQGTPKEAEGKTDKERREKLAEFIWNKESSKGQNNYSKCEAQGLINGIGYGIPGNGQYRCFNSHEEEMQVLMGWIIDHESQGMSRLEMLKHYTPGYTE